MDYWVFRKRRGGILRHKMTAWSFRSSSCLLISFRGCRRDCSEMFAVSWMRYVRLVVNPARNISRPLGRYSLPSPNRILWIITHAADRGISFELLQNALRPRALITSLITSYYSGSSRQGCIDQPLHATWRQYRSFPEANEYARDRNNRTCYPEEWSQ